MKVCGACVERPGPEHEHEPAVARVFPLDVADAGDPRLDDAAEDVEAHQVADVDARSARGCSRSIETSSSVASAGSGACPVQNCPVDHVSFGSRWSR